MSTGQCDQQFNITADQLRWFVDCAYETNDIIEVRVLPAAQSAWHQAGQLSGLTASLSQANYALQNIYAGINPRRNSGGSKSADVLLARSLFADWDGPSVDQVSDVIHSVRLPEPTILIQSGHGVHGYWRLIDPLHDLSHWTTLQRRLIATVNSDAKIKDPSRIMRLPGFWNVKSQPFVLCQIVNCDPNRRFPLAALSEILRPLPAVQENSARASRAASSSEWIDLLRGCPEGGRHDALVRLVGHYLGHGLQAAEVASICGLWNQRNQPPLPDAEIERAVRDLAERRHSEVERGRMPFGQRRQTIRLTLP